MIKIKPMTHSDCGGNFTQYEYPNPYNLRGCTRCEKKWLQTSGANGIEWERIVGPGPAAEVWPGRMEVVAE